MLSFEISHTKLAAKVFCFLKFNPIFIQITPPQIVRDLDWIENLWPFLSKTKGNDAKEYPKVQKYCIMSIKYCFTDFHIGIFKIKK